MAVNGSNSVSPESSVTSSARPGFEAPGDPRLTGPGRPPNTRSKPSKNGPVFPLAILTESASRREENPAQNHLEKVARKLQKYVMQAGARQLRPASRVAWCFRRVIPGREAVEVWYSSERERAYYAQLAVCGLFWECPLCGSRISERQRERLENGLERASEPFFLAMLTYTTAHHAGEPLAAVLARLQASYRAFWAGRWAQGFKERFQIAGTLKAVEITRGPNGWHPHFHTLVLARSFFTPTVKLEIQALAAKRWRDMTAKHGGFAGDHGLDVQFDKGLLGRYVTKIDGDELPAWGLPAEVTKAAVKVGRGENRTLTRLLYDFALENDQAAGRWWAEAVTTLKGTRHLMASKGFWELLGDDEIDESDLAVEPMSDGDRLLAELNLYQWRRICELEMRGQVLAEADSGDPGRLAAFLAAIGC